MEASTVQTLNILAFGQKSQSRSPWIIFNERLLQSLFGLLKKKYKKYNSNRTQQSDRKPSLAGMTSGPHPVLKTLSPPFARLSFVETCGPRWQRAKFGSVLRKRLQALAYGRTNSSSFGASGPCHLHGRQKKRERKTWWMSESGGWAEARHCWCAATEFGMTLLSAPSVTFAKSLSLYIHFAFGHSWQCSFLHADW